MAAIGFGQLHIPQNGPHDVVEVVGNAASHGAQSLHFVGFTQLHLQLTALRFSTFVAGEVARKDGGHFTV